MHDFSPKPARTGRGARRELAREQSQRDARRISYDFAAPGGLARPIWSFYFGRFISSVLLRAVALGVGFFYENVSSRNSVWRFRPWEFPGVARHVRLSRSGLRSRQSHLRAIIDSIFAAADCRKRRPSPVQVRVGYQLASDCSFREHAYVDSERRRH